MRKTQWKKIYKKSSNSTCSTHVDMEMIKLDVYVHNESKFYESWLTFKIIVIYIIFKIQ